jgi:signal transduction histidine kinase
MNRARPAPRFLRLVGGLTLTTISVALAVSFAIVLANPGPAVPPMNLGAAVAALRDPASVPRDGALQVERDCNLVDAAQAEVLVDAAAQLLRVATADLRAHWIAHAGTPLARVQIVSNVDGAAAGVDGAVGAALAQAQVELPPFELGLREADGCWRVVRPSHTPMQAWRLRILGAFALSAALLAPLAWWVARRLSTPLRHLARDAERLSLDTHSAPMYDDAGPEPRVFEVEVAREAMTTMHARLRNQSEDMTRMLAAVAHDLRTPLTALRLRAESAPPAQCARMVADIERMDAMITQVLDYVRGQSQPEAHVDTDLAELVDDCIAQAHAPGANVQASRIEPLRAHVEPLGLRRALTNLVENAVRYAGNARVGLWRDGATLVISVDDDGPGIPDDQIERLQQPFQRLEVSRSRDTGGIGLGLAVAHAAALRHAGRLVLRNRAEGGLSARLEWPADTR